MSITSVISLSLSLSLCSHQLINQSVSGYDAGQEMERLREGEGPRASGVLGILQQRLMGDFCTPGAVEATQFHKQGARSVNRCRHSAGTASRHGSTTGPVYNQASWDQKYQRKGAFAQHTSH